MSAATMIGLGLLAWAPLPVALALFLGQVIRLREQRRMRAPRRRGERINI